MPDIDNTSWFCIWRKNSKPWYITVRGTVIWIFWSWKFRPMKNGEWVNPCEPLIFRNRPWKRNILIPQWMLIFSLVVMYTEKTIHRRKTTIGLMITFFKINLLWKPPGDDGRDPEDRLRVDTFARGKRCRWRRTVTWWPWWLWTVISQGFDVPPLCIC